MPNTTPVLILLVSFLLAGCASDPERKGNKMIFRYNESSGITSLDPAFSRMQTNIWACNHLYDGLVRLNNRLEVEPALAAFWTISPDGLTYTFVLRQDVYFHHSPAFGEVGSRRLVAEDAVYSFTRLRDPALASPGAWVLNGLDSIYSQGGDTLVIQLKEAFSPFLGMLAMGYCSLVPKEAVEFYGPDFGRNPVGTGPFYFRAWRENEKLVLRRNPNYFMQDSAGNRLPYLDGVAIRFIPDKQAGFLEFLQHKLDFVSGLDASYKDEVLTPAGTLKKEYSHLVLNRNEYLNAEYLGVLTDPDKPASVGPAPLRRALNMAIDRRAMMRFLRNNIGLPAVKGFVPPSLMPDTALPAWDFNPTRARELTDSLRAAGALKPLVIETNPAYLDLCEYVQRQWQQVGIDARVEVSPPSTLRQTMATSRVGIFRASWIADYPDAENYYSLFYSRLAAPNGPNYTRFQHQEFDLLYEELRACINSARRKELLVKMAEIVESEAPVIPLFYDEALRFYRPEWEGLEGNALNLLDLRKVRRT